MFSDVEARLKRKNKILFTRQSESLQNLITAIRLQNHRVLILWALDCANQTLAHLEFLVPNENRPRQCLDTCRAWAEGRIKMKPAKETILSCHKAAKQLAEIPAALCHGIGQAGATVHVETHAIGLPMYELTALVLAQGNVCYEEKVADKIKYYEERLAYWKARPEQKNGNWAPFLLKDKLNKEQLRWEKEHDARLV